MTDADKRQLAIEAAEAIDPTIATDAQHLAETIDPSIKARADARKSRADAERQWAETFISEYERGLEAASPRTMAELAELKAHLLGPDA